MNKGSEAFYELITWSMKDVMALQQPQQSSNRNNPSTTTATTSATMFVDIKLAGEIRDKILGFRHAMESLYHYHDQPIHFYYIHFLSLLTVIYLPVFSVATAYSAGMMVQHQEGNDNDDNNSMMGIHWTSDVLSGIIVLLQCIFVVGLRLLGKALLDPYGNDLEDLSVIHYIQDTWQTTRRILHAEFPSTTVSPDLEIGLASYSASVGHPWDTRQLLRKRHSSRSGLNGKSNKDRQRRQTGNGRRVAVEPHSTTGLHEPLLGQR